MCEQSRGFVYGVNLMGITGERASIGEQSAVLAKRMKALTDTPVLLLDDVFSELDPDRSDALLRSLPPGQTVLSTAGGLPPGAVPGAVLHVHRGVVTAG